jgi:hypothetical protein
LPEELTGSDFEAGSETEMAFDGHELVTTAAVVIVTTDSGVDREVMFASFVPLAGSRLDTGNIGSLCVCKQVGVENNSSLFICS